MATKWQKRNKLHKEHLKQTETQKTISTTTPIHAAK